MRIRAAAFVFLASLAAVAALLPACDAPLPEVGFEGYDACSDEAHRGEDYFTDVMMPDFFQPYCSYCHWSDLEDRRGGTVGLDFDVFESARSRNPVVWARVASREMPPMARTPSTAELELLVDWLNCTAPEPSNLPQNLAEECPDDTLTFAAAGTVFTSHCTSCHHSELTDAIARSGAPETANYDTAQGVRDVGVDFVWQRIRDGEMPPPLSADRVTGADADLLYDWLSCGGVD
jgi:mono/diheme cytochrome c family protein